MSTAAVAPLAATTEPVVALEGIRREYPGVLAVDDASLALHAGEVLALVGKNGAGKSTLMKVMAGIQPADAGTITVGGEPVPSPYGPIEASRLGIAVVHQELEVVPGQTVAENVALGAGFPRRRGRTIDWAQLRRTVAALVDDLQPGISPDAPVETLSLAQQRLVMIARGLYRDARVIVLDEPSAALNDQEIETLHGVVRRLAARGCAVVYITHRLNEVLALTDRSVVMRDGTVVDDRPTAEFDPQSLVEAITGHALTRAEIVRPEPIERGAEVLRVDGLTRDGAVHDISFVAHAGEVVGIAGLAGAGRTELVRLIAGADRATAGTVHVRGRELRLRTPRDAIRAGIALVPEDRRNQGLLTGFSARFNLTLASLAKHRSGPLPRPRRASEQRSVDRAVERLRIKLADAERPVSLLSGGNQQKVVIAKWLELDPSVLIFDEPTQGIDVEAKAEALGLARALAGDGSAVLLVASDFTELVTTCDRVVVLREGELCGELVGDEISEARIVELCYRHDDETATDMEPR